MSPWLHVLKPLVPAGGADCEIMELLSGSVSLEEVGQFMVNLKVLPHNPTPCPFRREKRIST